MEYTDYYRILGVDRNASEMEIRRAYRTLARQLHPDLHPGNAQAEERFKTVNEAHEVLGDPDKRAKYDRLGASWQQWQRSGRDSSQYDWSQWLSPAPGGVRVEWGEVLGDLFGDSGSGAFSEFFRAIFGGTAGGGARGAARKTSESGGGRRAGGVMDTEAPVEITLAESLTGTTRLLERDGRQIRVRIPPGARSGSLVRVQGMGAQGYDSGDPGDLYLSIAVKAHPQFHRDGDDLRSSVDVDLCTAVLGGNLIVPTLEGDVSLTISAGTSPGTTFRLRARGMPRSRGEGLRGDLLLTVQVRIPKRLSSRERELFVELAEMQRSH